VSEFFVRLSNADQKSDFFCVQDDHSTSRTGPAFGCILYLTLGHKSTISKPGLSGIQSVTVINYYSHDLKIGQSGIQMVIFQTRFLYGFQMVKSAILFLTIQKRIGFQTTVHRQG
jgi:hypothetical protein